MKLLHPSFRLVHALALAALFLCCFVPLARAQDSFTVAIEPRLEQSQFLDLLAQLDLSRDDLLIPNTLFKEYQSVLADLQAHLDARADAAGRQRLAQAISGRASIPSAELREIQVAVLSVARDGFAPADQALDDLLSGLELTLNGESLARFRAALPQLRRQLFLHPRHAQAATSEYAGEGVDVLLLLHDARAPNAELAALDPADLAPITSTYESSLDQCLTAHAPEDRSGRLNTRIAALQRDAEALAHEEQARITRWQFIYNLNQQTVQRIGDLAAVQLGESTRDLWLARFDRECFAWMFRNRKPDRIIQWFSRQQLDPATSQKAQEIYASFIAGRLVLARKAIEVIIRGRREFHRALYSMMDPSALTDPAPRSLYEELLRNSGEQTALENSTTAALEALVPAEQRSSLSDALRQPAPRQPRN